VYAERGDEPALADCYFYHTMDVPGHGVVAGEWDLRAGVDTYLGHEDVRGKRVLELGTASGFLCFEMERRGAEVVAYDLDRSGSWDIVPFAGLDVPAIAADRATHIAKINNSWWLCRRAFGSAARVVYGSVYEIPVAIAPIDLCTFGAILLHVRDPLRALQSAAALRPQTIVVTEMERRKRFGFVPERGLARRSAYFIPDAATSAPFETWWSFSPESISNLLAIVGYRTARVVRHRQMFRGTALPMFTVVARRNEDRA
jgi:SAM-dependent methyltransferase